MNSPLGDYGDRWIGVRPVKVGLALSQVTGGEEALVGRIQDEGRIQPRAGTEVKMFLEPFQRENGLRVPSVGAALTLGGDRGVVDLANGFSRSPELGTPMCALGQIGRAHV